jgi:hypothetical protein
LVPISGTENWWWRAVALATSSAVASRRSVDFADDNFPKSGRMVDIFARKKGAVTMLDYS